MVTQMFKRAGSSAGSGGVAGMVLGEMTDELLAPCLRMVELLATPEDVPFLSKLLKREIIYRLLQGNQGNRCRFAPQR